MANINISLDTKTNKMSVTLNGVNVENVSYINVYRSSDEDDKKAYVEFSLETSKYDKDNDMHQRQVITSYGSSEAKKAEASKMDVKVFQDDIVLIPLNDCSDDIYKFLENFGV